MFELIKPLSLYKTNTMYVGFTESPVTVKWYLFFIDYLKLFILFSFLYSSATVSQILGPRYEILFVPL